MVCLIRHWQQSQATYSILCYQSIIHPIIQNNKFLISEHYNNKNKKLDNRHWPTLFSLLHSIRDQCHRHQSTLAPIARSNETPVINVELRFKRDKCLLFTKPSIDDIFGVAVNKAKRC